MIPYGRQDITQEDINSVINTLKSDFLTQGPVVPLFEKKLCDVTQAKYSIAVNSCTSALHLACLALNLGPGDILWTSPITFVASVNCALYCGAKVDFVDIDPSTALMSIESLKNKLIKAKKEGNLPKIIIPVHFAGQPCDMKEIYELGQEYGFKIIEDAAHAIGAKYERDAVGNCRYSDITVFSFHPVKVITTGEGGACLTNDANLANLIMLLRSHGITRNPSEMEQPPIDSWYYEQIALGFNYRMTDIQAALGLSQLDRLDEYILRRSEIALWYDKNITDISIVEPLLRKEDRTSSIHLYVLRVRNLEGLRDKLYSYLRGEGVGVNIHYIPAYRQPYLNSNIRLSGAEEHYRSTITLPIFPTISKKELIYVINQISRFSIHE